MELEKPKILIVDDVPANLLALENVLACSERTILKASSGNEALGILLEHDVALVILDVQMPGMDGFETAVLMRGNLRTKEIPIIFASAVHQDSEYVFKGYESGAVDYLFKPIEPVILRNKVNIFVELYQHKKRKLGELVEQLRAKNEELLRSNQDLEQFALIASHDLKEPLCVVQGYLSLLQKRYGKHLDEEAQTYLSAAKEGTTRSLRLIDDLLVFARFESEAKPFKSVDCNLAVRVAKENLGAALSEAKGELIIDPLSSIEGDESQITQVFQNLIGNAIKYHSKNVPPKIHVSCSKIDGAVRFSVRDNGIGIEKGSQERVFSLFHRLHGRDEYPGTGLGLALCKKIVERHGGKIWVSSEGKDGSEFKFTIARPKPRLYEKQKYSQ